MRLLPTTLALASIALLVNCRAEAANADGATTATPNYATGTVTLDGGKPLSGDIVDIGISIEGISEAGQRVSYTPIVKNGVYRQKLVPGQYRFGQARITVRFNGKDYPLKLAPVGTNWSKSQDAADGIVQHFVWKPTGMTVANAAEADPNNHTHWYGMSVGMRFATYREDQKRSPDVPPTGTTLTFTFTPLSPSIDGRTLSPIVMERTWRPERTRSHDDLNDLPPANYALTGVATLPNGTKKTMVFQGKGNYPNFVLKGDVPLDQDGIIGGYWKQLFTWGLE